MSRVRRFARNTIDVSERVLSTIGLQQPEARISADSQAYWTTANDGRWQSNSHWKNAPVFGDGALWRRIGEKHLAMLAEAAGSDGVGWGRVVEWGCGGGANAVHLAPHCTEFIGVDVAAASLEECARQVETECDTPFRSVLIDVAEPEQALAAIDQPCDLFVAFYVFELIPSPEYGERILRIASQLLAPGGLALIQVKYDDGTWRTRSRRRSYRSGLADMTTYSVPAFWELAASCGLEPQTIKLVPRDALDERYAYFHLRKPPTAVPDRPSSAHRSGG